MKLKALCEGIEVLAPSTLPEMEIEGVACDSKLVAPGFLFVAIRGERFDGTSYIEEAMSRGAQAVVSEEECAIAHGRLIKVANVRQALAGLAVNWYRHPARQLTVVGVTGTNGKTTVTYLVDEILKGAGRTGGLIGTIAYRIGERVIPATNTTPGPLELQSLLRQMSDHGLQYAVMEVSSHALHQHRTDGIDFQAAVFTNLTQDHLDYHKTMDEYFRAKARLFTQLAPTSWAIVNLDDPSGSRLVPMTRARCITYALHATADLVARDLELSLGGTRCLIHTPVGRLAIETVLIGRHNVANILAAIGVAMALGIEPRQIEQGIHRCTHIPGRLEAIHGDGGLRVFVDYAHTDDALRNVLTTLRELTHKRIIVVFGCGGDRDRGKRPRMGLIASALADEVIITTDNPRSEEPQAIAEEVAQGIRPGTQYEIILDRSLAIEEALLLATEKDVVLIAGKGHETYQIYRDTTVPFDDRSEVKRLLRKHRSMGVSTQHGG